ncbi:hypothetical protein MC885_002031 [Smutsia gigantea]|nr:hypothetical protein MC885_002031 [Smutsia gigantea]
MRIFLAPQLLVSHHQSRGIQLFSRVNTGCPDDNVHIFLTMPIDLPRVELERVDTPEPVMVNPLGLTGREDENEFHKGLSSLFLYATDNLLELKGTMASQSSTLEAKNDLRETKPYFWSAPSSSYR